MAKVHAATVLLLLTVAVPALCLDGPDPRTPSGQLAACGGAANWNALGYLKFTVKITSPSGVQGPFLYRWDRRDGFLRLTAPAAGGGKTAIALDLTSRTGGAWVDGTQLTGAKLSDTVTWALQRFGEDTLWLTFPLDWGMPGVKVTPLPDAPESGGAPAPETDVLSSVGDWKVTLDPATGRVARTVLSRSNGTLTVTWSDWRAHGGVYFAHQRTIAETGETVDVDVLQALPEPPAGDF